MKKKLILFDWGNIVESHLTGYSCVDAYNKLFVECGYTGEKEPFKVIAKYKLDCIKTIDEYKIKYEIMKKECGLNKTFNEYVDIYKKVFENIDYYKDVADYEVSLKDRCYIGIYSDLTLFDIDRLDKQVGLANYDYLFLSYKYGVEKPDLDYFKQVNSELPFEGKDILFIDDKKENIESAKKVGWNGFQTTGLELDKIKEVCENFLKE